MTEQEQLDMDEFNQVDGEYLARHWRYHSVIFDDGGQSVKLHPEAERQMRALLATGAYPSPCVLSCFGHTCVWVLDNRPMHTETAVHLSIGYGAPYVNKCTYRLKLYEGTVKINHA